MINYDNSSYPMLHLCIFQAYEVNLPLNAQIKNMSQPVIACSMGNLKLSTPSTSRITHGTDTSSDCPSDLFVCQMLTST